MKNLSVWEPVQDIMKGSHFEMSSYSVARLQNGSLLSILSYYKYISKLISNNKRVLHFNCEDGLGTYILSKEAGYAKGIANENDIAYLKSTWDKIDNVEFEESKNFVQRREWDAVLQLDAERLSLPDFNMVKNNLLKPFGVYIVGGKYNERIKSNFSKYYLDDYFGQTFKYTFKFYTINEHVFPGNNNNSNYLIYMGVKGDD